MGQSNGSNVPDSFFTSLLPTSPEVKQVPKMVLPSRDYAQLLDFVSSFLFPLVFIIFNIIYWVSYVNMVLVYEL